MKKWFKNNALIIVLWLILVVIFVVGGIYFNHISRQAAALVGFLSSMGGGV